VNAQFCGNCGEPLGKRGNALIVSAVAGAVILGMAIAAYVVFIRPKAKSYYPLTEGMSLQFQMDNEGIETYGASGITSMETQMGRSRELNGKTVTPRRSTRGRNRPTTEFLAEDDSGISIVGAQLPADDGPVEVFNPPNPPFRYVLKYPIRVGTTWDDFAVDRQAPNWRVHLKSTIESINQTVTVPAGTFARCLKVKSVGSTGRISVQQSKWYAPGVGMIKFIDYRELLDGSAPPQQMTMQLQEFR